MESLFEFRNHLVIIMIGLMIRRGNSGRGEGATDDSRRASRRNRYAT